VAPVGVGKHGLSRMTGWGHVSCIAGGAALFTILERFTSCSK
jgi:hypothetical protein